jgi:hypothetical protein
MTPRHGSHIPTGYWSAAQLTQGIMTRVRPGRNWQRFVSHRTGLPPALSVRIGLLLFALGLVAIAVDVVPSFLGHHNTGLWLNLSCLLAPLGFALIIVPTWRAGRRSQREALQQLSS